MKSFSYLLILLILGMIVSCDKDDPAENTDIPAVLQDETKAETISSSSGGDIVMTSGVKVEVPANALSTDKHITVETIDPTQEENESKISEDIKGDMVSAVVRCGPEGTTFESPVEITIPYYPDMFPENTTIDDMIVISYSGDSVELVPFTVDAINQVVIAEAMHFSDFVVVSEQGILVYRGKMYNTVVINGKEWMAENLAFLPTVNRRADTSSYSPRYYVLDYDGTDRKEAMSSENYTTYGVIYNWAAAMDACPQGWRVPTKEDWEGLINYIDVHRGPFRTHEENGKTVIWFDLPKHLKTIQGWTILGTDDFGFSAKPGAGTDSNASFYSNLYLEGRHVEVASWWSSTGGSHRGEGFAYQAGITDIARYSDNYQLSQIGVDDNIKRAGVNVRCIKN